MRVFVHAVFGDPRLVFPRGVELMNWGRSGRRSSYWSAHTPQALDGNKMALCLEHPGTALPAGPGL